MLIDFIDRIVSFFNKGEKPSEQEARDVAQEAEAAREEFQGKSTTCEQYAIDNRRLYAENEALKGEVKQLKARISVLEEAVAKIKEKYKALAEHSKVVTERLKRVAFGKKNERFDKIIGKQTRRILDAFFNDVDDTCATIGMQAGTGTLGAGADSQTQPSQDVRISGQTSASQSAGGGG